jgi:hypothetical protein
MALVRGSLAIVGVLSLAQFGCTSVKSTEGDGGATSGGNGDTGGRSGGGGGKGGSSSTSTGSPDDDLPVGDDLVLLFNPAYSAFDGVHDFKLPAIVQGVADVEWSARPADAVDLSRDTSTGGVMITTRKPGKVQIIARAGALSGSAELHITDATPEDWELGEHRYNNEIPFPMIDLPDGGFRTPDGGYADVEIPNDLSCRNCHGAGAMALDVEHTPQQTGGYSDDDLVSIFTMGMKPAGSTFHTPFPEFLYERFHTWEASEEERKGLVVYLRSLEPKTQGPLDFMGLRDMFNTGGAP